jgi:hypothetical protein
MHTRQNITINSSVQNYGVEIYESPKYASRDVCIFSAKAILIESNFVLMAVGN